MRGSRKSEHFLTFLSSAVWPYWTLRRADYYSWPSPHLPLCSIARFWLVFAKASEEIEQDIVEGNSNINVFLIRKVVYLVNLQCRSQMEAVYIIHDLIHTALVLESNEVWSSVGSTQKNE